jgi:flagellar basal-body rod protein FlgC
MMMMMDIYDVTASAMTAQRLRMDTIASNLANVNSTRDAQGKLNPYKRKNVVFAPVLEGSMASSGGTSSKNGLIQSLGTNAQGMPVYRSGISMSDNTSTQTGIGVEVLQISEETKNPTRMVYDPSHPDANDKGFVEFPNINTVTEMVDMISASRAYEASVTAFQTSKSMNEATLDM